LAARRAVARNPVTGSGLKDTREDKK
jgi:hypothetical protein